MAVTVKSECFQFFSPKFLSHQNVFPHQWIRINRGRERERERERRAAIVSNTSTSVFSAVHHSHPPPPKKRTKKEVGWVSVSTETFNNALKCHDCLLTWTEWPVCTSSPSYHYDEKKCPFFCVCVCVFRFHNCVLFSHAFLSNGCQMKSVVGGRGISRWRLCLSSLIVLVDYVLKKLAKACPLKPTAIRSHQWTQKDTDSWKKCQPTLLFTEKNKRVWYVKGIKMVAALKYNASPAAFMCLFHLFLSENEMSVAVLWGIFKRIEWLSFPWCWHLDPPIRKQWPRLKALQYIWLFFFF